MEVTHALLLQCSASTYDSCSYSMPNLDVPMLDYCLQIMAWLGSVQELGEEVQDAVLGLIAADALLQALPLEPAYHHRLLKQVRKRILKFSLIQDQLAA